MSRITGNDAKGLMEAYGAVYTPQELTEEQVWEEVETWVNSLLEEGYDLSDYTWEEMYESYIEEEQLMERGAPTDPKARAAYDARVAQNRAALGNTILYGNSAGKKPEAPVTRNRNVRGGGTIKPPAGTPSSSPAPAVTASAKAAPTTSPKPQFGTTTPRGSSVTSTGVSGLSAADRAAFSAGGGNAAAQRGMGQTTAQVIAQGKKNLDRMDQGKPAPAGAKPTSGGSSVNPKSGLSAYSANSSASASRPAASASRPAAGAPTRPVATAPATPKPAAPAGGSALDRATAAAGRPAAFSPKPQSDVGKMIDASKARQAAQTPKPATPAPARPMGSARERMLQRQSFDVFDVIKGHLIDEGYADTEESALVIMANMSESWKNSIIG